MPTTLKMKSEEEYTKEEKTALKEKIEKLYQKVDEAGGRINYLFF